MLYHSPLTYSPLTNYNRIMKSEIHFLAPPGPCGYLPDQTWRLEYEFFSKLSAAEYLNRMENGWRRFGASVFRPRCPACNGPLFTVAKAAVAPVLPPGTRRTYQAFSHCRSCGQVYWHGAHIKRLEQIIDSAVRTVGRTS